MNDASLSSRLNQLVSVGRAAEAFQQLSAAAAGGDPEALFLLATWRVSGRIVRRDTAAARSLLGKAGAAGDSYAALLYAHFLANGTGGPPDWRAAFAELEGIADRQPEAAAQLDMLSRMPVDEGGEPTSAARLETLSTAPAIHCARGFLSGEECRYLIQRAEPTLQPSTVTELGTGRSFPHPDRKSDGMFFGVGNEDLVVSAINRRIAQLTETTTEQAEPLQILRYGPGGEFRKHFDFGKDGGNQRILTAIIYLTDAYTGGETFFFRTGLRFRGAPGDLLLFRNVTPDGAGDPLTEHAGLPVESGVKIVASRWIWREPYRLAPPVPLLRGS